MTYSTRSPHARVQGHFNLTVLADGFVSNAKELREEACRRNELAATSTAGWIAQAYGWWGSALCRYVLGQFVAAVLDHSQGSLTLLQDSLGIAPLFYSRRPDGIAFASRLIDLVSLLRPSGLNLEYFGDALARGIPASEHTPYPNIARVRYGASVRWHAGRVDVAQPWKPSANAPRIANEAGPATATEFVERLSVAVERCTPPDSSHARVWCELSGGLDSTSVLAIGTRQGRQLEAFTFTDTHGDDDGDSAMAASVAAQLKVPWHTLDAGSTLPFSVVPDDFRAEPGTEILSERHAAYRSLLREAGVGVLLTGVGGDVTLGGRDCLPHHLADPLYRGQMRLLFSTLREWQRGDPSQRSLLFWFTHYSLRTAARHLFRARLNAPNWYERLPEWIAADFARKYRVPVRARADQAPRHPLPGRHALWQEVYGQAAALGVGSVPIPEVQRRHPLLDRELVEFMLAIPYQERQRSDGDRVLQRRALRGILPECVLERRTKGTGQRSLDIGLRASAPWRQILTENPRLVAAGFVDREAWLGEVARARFGLYESLRHFVTAACIECWLRRHEQGLPAPEFQLANSTLLQAESRQEPR